MSGGKIDIKAWDSGATCFTDGCEGEAAWCISGVSPSVLLCPGCGYGLPLGVSGELCLACQADPTRKQ